MTVLAVLALVIWVYLLAGHGRFWQSGPVLGPILNLGHPPRLPSVTAIVPARDEAAVIGQTLASLLAQDYAGPFHVLLVDDNSTDATAAVAHGLTDPDARLATLTGSPRPPGWAGKLWALAQGIEQTESDYVLLTDADILHDPAHVAALVAQAETRRLDMVSEMVALSCQSWAERALIPAFVFFFQLLYPFAWVNDPLRSTAAAAGGTVLVRRDALARAGGIAAIRGALIDDVTLAAALKRGGPIWLGHSALARSIRPYPRAADIWRMIARSAYEQLRRSPSRLILCLLGMVLVWLIPPAACFTGPELARVAGAAAWAGMAWSYLPTLRRFGLSPAWAPFLPLVAVFYMAATLASALNHHLGRGVAWKGRAYA